MAIKRILAILVAMTLAMLLFAACGKDEPVINDDPLTTAADVETTEDAELSSGVEDTTLGGETTLESESASEGETTTAVGDTTGVDDTTELGPTTTTKPATAPKMPEGKAEILAAYTKVVNKVKVDMPQYVSNDWQTMSNVDMSGIVYGPISLAARGFLETAEQTTPEIHAAGGHPKWFALPTDDLKEACVLTDTSKIESATCVKSGDYYVITITLVQEKDPYMDKANPKAVTSWHGRMFDVIDIVEVVDVAKSLGFNADGAYCTFKGTATLKYNPVTNECVSLDHVIDVRMYLGGKAAKVIADYHFYDFKW